MVKKDVLQIWNRGSLAGLKFEREYLIDSQLPEQLAFLRSVYAVGNPTPFKGGKLERLIHYRNRAEELRIIAEDFADDAVRETLLDVAATYDQLANEAQHEI